MLRLLNYNHNHLNDNLVFFLIKFTRAINFLLLYTSVNPFTLFHAFHF